MENTTKTKRTKKQNGEGTIVQRKDGRYEAKIVDSRTGKRVSVYGNTLAEVKRKLKEKKKEILIGNAPTVNSRVDDYMLSWLKTFKFNSLKRTTYDKHEQMLKTHIIPKIGNLKMKDVTANDLQNMFNDISKIRAYSTMKKIYEVVNPCFKHAALIGDIQNNPVLGVRLPKEKNMGIKTKEIQIYKDEDLLLIEKTMNDWYYNNHLYRLAPMYLFLAYTGLRRGELLALKWDDINFKTKTIKVNKSLTRYRVRDNETLEYDGGYNVELLDPKTSRSNRNVPLNTKAISLLVEMKKRNELENIESEYVCCSKNGDFLCSRSFDQMLERICRKADIKFLGLHALRHTFASKCFNAKIDVKIISEILGHSDVKITLNTYVHLLEEQKIEAVELLDAI